MKRYIKLYANISLLILFFSFQVRAEEDNQEEVSQLQELILPIQCELGKTCWISNLPAHQINDKHFDFRCGSKTYYNHSGTDIALKDLSQMNEGVNVLSPIDGEVKSLRDGIKDINVNIAKKYNVSGKECGNGVIIVDDFYEIKLCHLKQGSIDVDIGDKVKSGDVVAQVGLSGLTEYPHLHITVSAAGKEEKKLIDPFYGRIDECGKNGTSIWENKDEMLSNSSTGVVYNYDFAFNTINKDDLRTGNFYAGKSKKPNNLDSLVGFVDIFSPDKGDIAQLKIISQNGEILSQSSHAFNKYYARYFLYNKIPITVERPLLDKYELVVNYKKNGSSEIKTFRKVLELTQANEEEEEAEEVGDKEEIGDGVEENEEVDDKEEVGDKEEVSDGVENEKTEE